MTQTIDKSITEYIDPDLAEWYFTLSPQEQESLLNEVAEQIGIIEDESLWSPNIGPQTEAYESEADILGYGGAAGGGKTEILLGLAKMKHRRAVIFRRVFPNLRAIIERSREVYNPTGERRMKDSYNESLHRWQFSDGQMIEFEACQHEKDKFNQRGRPRDFYGFDEVTEFSRTQVEFITAWLRATNPNQRCRIVMTFNPPTDNQGSWVIEYFLPWLAYLFPHKFTHPNPAEPGELRYYATIDGIETECENGESFDHNGETINPLSRTFIPARLEDNPYLSETNYRSVLQSLPEPLRSQLLYGDFGAEAKDDEWQVIPTAWVRLAQKRWGEREQPEGVSLSGVGVDVARGGKDKLSISKRYDNWFAEVISFPGIDIEDGPVAAEKVRQNLEDNPSYINLDVVGVGTSAYDSLKEMYSNVVPINAAGKSSYRDKSGKLKARNLRAEYHWRMREALDPEHGDDIALPPGNEVLADLCAPRYSVTTAGIQIEKKDDIKTRINRSPDVGESILLAHLIKIKQSPPKPQETRTSSKWSSATGGSRWRR